MSEGVGMALAYGFLTLVTLGKILWSSLQNKLKEKLCGP